MSLSLRPKRILQVLNIVVLLLILAHVVSQFFKFGVNSGQDYGWTHLFDLDREMNFPTYYSSTMLFICSVLLGVIAYIEQRVNKGAILYWMGLALIFLFLSVDEYSSLHEKLILPLQSALNVSGPLFFAWIIPYGIALVVILLIFINFWISLPPKTRSFLFLGALLYVLGALGLEMLGGYYFDLHDGTKDVLYTLITTTEETLELAGIQVMFFALLSHIETEFSELNFRLSPTPAATRVPYNKASPGIAASADPLGRTSQIHSSSRGEPLNRIK